MANVGRATSTHHHAGILALDRPFAPRISRISPQGAELMSFKDLVSSSVTRGAPSDQDEARIIEGLVFKLASSLGQLKRLVDSLGSARDTRDHRDRITEANASIQGQAKVIKEKLVALHGGNDPSSSNTSSDREQAKGRKLLADFASILQDYKETQKICKDRESVSLPRPSSNQASNGLPRGDIESGSGQKDEEVVKQALLQEQRQAQSRALDNAVTFQEALIEERDRGITEIARQIGEVNEMFQDLAVLVDDQGSQILTIDDHISSAAERTREGVREVVNAERSQRYYQNKCLWLWLISAAVVSVVLILVFS